MFYMFLTRALEIYFVLNVFEKLQKTKFSGFWNLENGFEISTICFFHQFFSKKLINIQNVLCSKTVVISFFYANKVKGTDQFSFCIIFLDSINGKDEALFRHDSFIALGSNLTLASCKGQNGL